MSRPDFSHTFGNASGVRVKVEAWGVDGPGPLTVVASCAVCGVEFDRSTFDSAGFNYEELMRQAVVRSHGGIARYRQHQCSSN